MQLFGYWNPKLRKESRRCLSRLSPLKHSEISWLLWGRGEYLFPSDLNLTGHQVEIKTVWTETLCRAMFSYFRIYDLCSTYVPTRLSAGSDKSGCSPGMRAPQNCFRCRIAPYTSIRTDLLVLCQAVETSASRFVLIDCRANGLNSLRSGGRNSFFSKPKPWSRRGLQNLWYWTERSIGPNGPKFESALVLEMAATA
jgi:hypothetical protein